METASQTRLRSIAIPAEHGSWGLTLEPILLGLLVAPSWGGAGLAIAAFGLFLLRWPLKVTLLSRAQGRRERMVLALRVVVVYAVVALGGLALALTQSGWQPLWPVALALPFGIVFYVYDARNRSRSWQAELAGPIAFSAVAPSIALADGWAFAPALALWAVLVARAVPSVLYVRARIRLDRKRPIESALPHGAHVLALAGVGAMAWAGLLPPLTVGVFVLLMARAVWGLSQYRRPVSIKVIGFSEMALGLLNVMVVAIG